jgi:hypothetical protein
MESTYIDEPGKAEANTSSWPAETPVEREWKRPVTQASNGSEPSQPTKDQEHLNVTSYVHEWSHPAPE